MRCTKPIYLNMRTKIFLSTCVYVYTVVQPSEYSNLLTDFFLTGLTTTFKRVIIIRSEAAANKEKNRRLMIQYKTAVAPLPFFLLLRYNKRIDDVTCPCIDSFFMWTSRHTNIGIKSLCRQYKMCTSSSHFFVSRLIVYTCAYVDAHIKILITNDNSLGSIFA